MVARYYDITPTPIKRHLSPNLRLIAIRLLYSAVIGLRSAIVTISFLTLVTNPAVIAVPALSRSASLFFTLTYTKGAAVFDLI